MEEEKGSIWHKIMPNHKYRIWRKDFNGNTFYNILVSQKEYDNTESKYYIPVSFKKGIEVANETDIVIKKAIENLRSNKNVEENKRPYAPIFSYMITEFEIVEREEQKQAQAYQKFQETLKENELDEEIKNAELPF